MEGKKSTSRLRPYDSSMEDNLTMYDDIPYERDTDLCNQKTITLHSPNMLKYYSYEINQSTYQVPNQDDLFVKKLEDMRQRLASAQSQPESAGEKDVITQEQIQELVEDYDKGAI